MNGIKEVGILCLGLLCFWGCAELDTPQYQFSYSAISNPIGARVYMGTSPDDLRYYLTTPYFHETDVSKEWSGKYFQARKEGYKDSEIFQQPVSYDRFAILQFDLEPLPVKAAPVKPLLKPFKRPETAPKPRAAKTQPYNSKLPLDDRPDRVDPGSEPGVETDLQADSMAAMVKASESIPDSPGIPKSVKAKSEYILAEEMIQNGDYQNALRHLNNSKALLNETNSKIQYLLVKTCFGLKEYARAKKELGLFFDLTPESMSGTKIYNEMVVYVSKIEDAPRRDKAEKLRKEKADQEENLRKEAAYREKYRAWDSERTRYKNKLKDNCERSRRNWKSKCKRISDDFHNTDHGPGTHRCYECKKCSDDMWDAKYKCENDLERKMKQWDRDNPKPVR